MTGSPLAAGTVLAAGDLIETSPTGRVTLALAGGAVRLAGGATCASTRSTPTVVGLTQTAGRAWHRVGVDAGTYRVRTADVTWTATGPRSISIAGPTARGDGVRAIGIEHDVQIDGPDLRADSARGRRRRHRDRWRVSPDVDLGDATAADLADRWLRSNAEEDLARGWDVGIFRDRADRARPLRRAPSRPPCRRRPPRRPRPTTPGTEPPANRPPCHGRTDAEGHTEAHGDTNGTPTPKPTPKPHPTLADLTLTATACPGRFMVLGWSKAGAEGFDHYQTIRSTSTSIKPVYPPKAPAVAPDALYDDEPDHDLGASTTASRRHDLCLPDDGVRRR